jgi:hypothetical protein
MVGKPCYAHLVEWLVWLTKEMTIQLYVLEKSIDREALIPISYAIYANLRTKVLTVNIEIRTYIQFILELFDSSGWVDTIRVEFAQIKSDL